MAAMTAGEGIRLVVQGMFVGVALGAPVGPINVEIVRRGLHGGFLRGWLVGLGAVSADTIYAALVVTGLTPVADNPTVRIPLLIAGAGVLGFLGVSSLRVAFQGVDPEVAAPSGGRSYVTGFLMAALSPFGILYWLSIGAALVASAVSQAGTAGSPLIVGGVTAGLICWVTFLSILAQGGRRFVSPSAMRWITGLSGLVLLGFGLSFGVQGARALAAL